MPLKDAHLEGLFFTKMIYSKEVKTYKDQLQILIERGLEVDDQDRVIRYLSQINYYRLSAYFIPYQEVKDKFFTGVSFDLILNTYLFDRKLRLLVFDCIERIEIALRTQIVYVLAHTYSNSHWQDDQNIFKTPILNQHGKIDFYRYFQEIIAKNLKSKTVEVFIQHYKSKYSFPGNPPSWMCIELLTIGELSLLFRNLKFSKDKQAIADFFGLHYRVLISWLHSLTYVRNICAHHSRLWNRELAIKPDILKKPKHPWVDSRYNNNKRVFYILSIVKYLLIGANPNNNLKKKLIEIIDKYPMVPIKYMGIPSNNYGVIDNWQEQPIWK